MQASTIIYEDTTGDGIIGGFITSFDGAGRRYMGLARSPDEENNNVTVCDLFISDEDGAFSDPPNVSFAFRDKIDHIDYDFYSETSLEVYSDTHATSGIVRDREEGYVWEDVWTPKIPSLPPPAPVLEPLCVPPGNLPNFHQNDNVTRGQAAKMIVIGADIPIPTDVETLQSFQDVPPGSTFHPWIEALHAKRAVNGRPCRVEPQP